MYTLESLPVGLTGSFGADRLRDMLTAVQKGPVGELPVVSEASGPTLVGFPAVGSAEYGLGVFWSRLLVAGLYEPVLWIRPTKACFVDGTACDWVGFPMVLATGNYQAFELGYLYQGDALKQEATALSLTAAQLEAALAIAIAGSNPKDTLDETLAPWSVNPATAKAILAYVAPISTNIQWDASGNAGFLHNVQVMGGLTVDGSLNANGATLNTLNVDNDAEFGSTTTQGDSVVNGNQTVVGYQNTGNYYEQNFTITGDSGIVTDYGKIRVKDGYLDIIALFHGTRAVGGNLTFTITVPQSIMNNIVPVAGGATGTVRNGTLVNISGGSTRIDSVNLFKSSATAIGIAMNIAGIASGTEINSASFAFQLLV